MCRFFFLDPAPSSSAPTYTAEENSPSAERMAVLAGWGASPEFRAGAAARTGGG